MDLFEYMSMQRKKEESPLAVVIQDGDYVTAGIWVSVVVLIAFVIIFLMNFISGRKMKNTGRW